ncbi:MAG: hypothetical protein V4593_05960 [Pseudomonadota bacterium]
MPTPRQVCHEYIHPPLLPTDFNFFPSRWQVSHRRLKQRLVGSTEWEEFGGSCSLQTLLGGLGNVDYNVIELPTRH